MKIMIFCSYFRFERKRFLSDCFSFYMYIDMCGRIAGKQDMPSLIIDGHNICVCISVCICVCTCEFFFAYLINYICTYMYMSICIVDV